MNIYKKAEKELAELLGWTNFCEWAEDRLLGVAPNAPDMVRVTEWCSDDAEAFKLVVEHNIDVLMWVRPSAQWDQDVALEEADPCNHGNNKLLATRYAIVQSVIAKLKASK